MVMLRRVGWAGHETRRGKQQIRRVYILIGKLINCNPCSPVGFARTCCLHLQCSTSVSTERNDAFYGGFVVQFIIVKLHVGLTRTQTGLLRSGDVLSV